MSQLIRDLDTLAEIVCAHNPTLRSRLRPGISSGEQQRLLGSRMVRLHPDVVSLYSWHDGIDRPGLRGFTPGLDFLTFQEAVVEYDSLLAQARGLAKEFDLTIRDFGIDVDFFTVVKSSGGTRVMVDGDPDSGTYGQVFPVKFDDFPPLPPLGFTLPGLVRLWIRLHEEGIYIARSDGLWDIPEIAPDWVQEPFAYGLV